MKTETAMSWATGATAALVVGLAVWLIASNAHAQNCVGGPEDISCQLTSIEYTALPEGDLPVPVFSNSSGDQHTRDDHMLRGHINRGLGAVLVAPWTMDKTDLLRVILEYTASEPASVTFDVEITNVTEFHTFPARWKFGDQSGTTDDLTIEGLALKSGQRQALWIEPPAPETWPIVYSRQPHNSKSYSDEHGSVGSAEPWRTRTNGAARQKTTTEYDLVFDRRDGTEPHVIHNCTGSEQICAAGDVDKDFRAERAIYSVGWGTKTRPIKVRGGPWTDMQEFDFVGCDLWIWDARTKKRHKFPSAPGECRRYPIFVTDEDGRDRIVYTSDIDGIHPPQAYNGNRFNGITTMQLYTAVIEGGKLVDIQNLSRHEFAVTSPAAFSNGELWYTSWHGAWPRKIPSPLNAMWLSSLSGFDRIRAHGADAFKVASHLEGVADPSRRGVGAVEVLIPRPVVDIPGEWYLFGSYYRDNHIDGQGDIFGCKQLEPGVEGALRADDIPELYRRDSRLGSGRYIPSSCRLVVLYGMGTDHGSPRFGLDGKALGSAGQPFATPEGEFGYIHTDGHPYVGLPLNHANREYMGGVPVSRSYPVLAKTMRVTNPRDPEQVEPLACYPEETYNCFDAAAFVPYQSIHGKPAPKPVKIHHGTGPARLQVVNAFATDSRPIPYNVSNALTAEEEKVAFQGNFDFERFPQDLHALRIETFTHHKTEPREKGLASVSWLKDCEIYADGSIDCEVPAETPLLMSGAAEDGDKIATDLRGHSLRHGETRCCIGCHLGHSEGSPMDDCGKLFRQTEAFKQSGGD